MSFQAAVADPRIRAVINQDGWMYGRSAEATGVPVPAMLMLAEVDLEMLTASQRARFSEVDSRFWNMLSMTDSTWYRVTIRGASHMNFSDRSLFVPHDPRAIHPRAAHALINVYSLEFFNRHLLGSKDSPLLTGDSYRDVVLTVKPGPESKR